MSKKLCKLVSDGFLDDHSKKYMRLVDNSKHLCTKCGRVANDASSLCHAKKMKDKKEDEKEHKKKHKKDIIKSDDSTDDHAKKRIKISKKALRLARTEAPETYDALDVTNNLPQEEE